MSETSQSREPSFITPENISEMTDEQFETLLQAIVIRRSIAKQFYDNTSDVAGTINQAGIAAKLEKKLAQLFKIIESFSNMEAKSKDIINDIRVLRLMGGVDPGI